MARPAFPISVDENPSFVYTRTGDDVTQIDMVITTGAGTTTYRKLLTYTSNRVDTESTWVKQ